jgi:D-amino-acid dehydrogenase
MLKKDIVVLGAGMVGVCSALALQKKGLNVTLIDSGDVGAQTSFGNAGMITPSSIIPFNNPNLFKALPSFLANKSAGFRYDLGYALSEFKRLLQFLSFARKNSTEQRINQLYQLIERSIELHREQASASEVTLRASGWLRLYRNAASLDKSHYERAIFEQFNVNTQIMDRDQLHLFEPNLKDIYTGAVHICDALSVASPSALVQAYAEQFIDRGGELLRLKICDVQQQNSLWLLEAENKEKLACKDLIIATGPWSKEILKKVGLQLPMIFERGAHREYQVCSGQKLSVPIHDVDGSFVATPCAVGVRISCGVELNQQAATYHDTQLDIVENNAREGFGFSLEHHSQWHGSRPTMPDSLPLIGPTKLAGLWLNTGHQHIGFSTGPSSAEILADLITGDCGVLSGEAFSPKRFNL